MIGIRELLKHRGLDLDRPIKLIRHQHSGGYLHELLMREQLETYQRFQGSDVFNCEVIVSFIGLERRLCRLVGVYKVNGYLPAKDALPADYPYLDYHDPENDIYYDLEKMPGFEDLERRVIIDWGAGTRSWHQWLNDKDKEVVQVFPRGYTREWPGFLDFNLPFAELEKIVGATDANIEWHTRLSSVAGIYLISNGRDLYVGSAYGREGIIGRWKQYVYSDGHGGNVQLEKFVSSKEGAKYDLTFSILRTLPLSTPEKEVIKIEHQYMTRLGSRAHGLNSGKN